MNNQTLSNWIEAGSPMTGDVTLFVPGIASLIRSKKLGAGDVENLVRAWGNAHGAFYISFEINYKSNIVTVEYFYPVQA